MHQRMIRRASLRLASILIGALVLTLESMLPCIPHMASADQSLPTMTIGYQSGKITAVYEKTFQIDGRTYSLTSDAVILDDSGNQADVGMLAVTLEVQYHLKKEQNDKIDRMIVFLPR